MVPQNEQTNEKRNEGMSKRKQTELKRLKKIVSVLEMHPNGLWMREIARQTNLHVEIVKRIISRHTLIFEEYADFTQYNIKLKLIRLRDGYNLVFRNLVKEGGKYK